MTVTKSVLALVLLLATALALSACGGAEGQGSNTARAAMLPEPYSSAPPRVREAYEHAVANPDELAKYPCYCGCGAMGHTSNLSCYV